MAGTKSDRKVLDHFISLSVNWFGDSEITLITLTIEWLERFTKKVITKVSENIAKIKYSAI